jgi:uncharacterized protein YndB with AHSA1/START domain
MTPIRKTLTVPLRPDAAFDLFARRLPDWWPTDRHSRSAARKARPRAVTVTPGLGGGIEEITDQGQRTVWARFTAWDPGRRLSMQWHFDEEEAATDVVVTFTPEGTGTRVDLTHGAAERPGADVAGARGMGRSCWETALARFGAAAARLLLV